jgi:hypothetical protein
MFGNYFNQPVDKLPNNLQSIKFGYFFNQPVDNLPKNLQSITFGKVFNQPVDKLPCSIKELGFWSHCSIKNNLPDFIKNLKIFFDDYDGYNQPIENLPYNIEKIIINNKSEAHFLKKIPFGCKVFDEQNQEINI